MNRASFLTGAVIVGAGSSQRMGMDKIIMPLGGKPVISWSVDVCQRSELIDRIVIVLNDSQRDFGQKLASEQGWTKVVDVCPGGNRRQDSVREGLTRLNDCEWVLIHDGARPFLTPDLIRLGLESARSTGSAVLAVPVKDTIKQGNADLTVRKTFDREELWAAQTPQVFRFDIITRAYQNTIADVTDDASMVEQLGYKVKLCMGSYGNIKITTPEDLALAELIARKKATA